MPHSIPNNIEKVSLIAAYFIPIRFVEKSGGMRRSDRTLKSAEKRAKNELTLYVLATVRRALGLGVPRIIAGSHPIIGEEISLVIQG